MSDTNNTQGSAEATNTASGTTEAPTRTRESRSNHAVAQSHVITDAASAQAFCDAALEATRNDKQSSMFNGSGFVTPSILEGHETANLIRMGSSIINALARKSGADGAIGDTAREGLTLLRSYAESAAEIQENLRSAEIERQYQELQARRSGNRRTAKA